MSAVDPTIGTSPLTAQALDVPPDDVRAPRSPWRQPLAVAGLVILAAWLVVVLLAPVLASHDPLAQDAPRLLAPSGAHPLGTDELGRDVLSRLLYGARTTIPLGLLLVACAMTIGAALGLIAGFFGGVVDSVVMRAADVVFAFPGIILAMAVAAALGPSLRNAVLAVVVVSWPAYARVVRGLVLALREADFVSASRLLGSPALRTMRVELGPNVVGPLMVMAALDLANAVLLLSGLSFLGLGAQPPAAEWGAMVSSGAQNFDSWWIGTFPGLAILTVVLACNFLGDTLRDVLDPRTARMLRG